VLNQIEAVGIACRHIDKAWLEQVAQIVHVNRAMVSMPSLVNAIQLTEAIIVGVCVKSIDKRRAAAT
jgi:hypothetical protein